MTEKIIIAGEGGQGIMLLGKVLAEAAMLEGRFVTWLPSYGAEVRGGTAHCMVIVSDEQIGSPYIKQADSAIIMNNPSFERFKERVGKKGLIIVNSSLVPPQQESGRRFVFHPFTSLAIGAGNIKVANMVAIGCFIRLTGLVKKESVLKVIQAHTPAGRQEVGEVNKRALAEGMALA